MIPRYLFSLFLIILYFIPTLGYSGVADSIQSNKVDSLLLDVKNDLRFGSRSEILNKTDTILNIINSSNFSNKECLLGLTYLHRGYAFEYESNKSNQCFDKSWKHLLACGSPREQILYKKNVGIYHALSGNIDSALIFLTDAYNLSEKNSSYEFWYQINLTLVRLYSYEYELDKIHYHLNIAQEIAIKNNDSTEVSETYRILGELTDDTDNYKLAEEYYLKSLKWVKKSDDKDLASKLKVFAGFYKKIGDKKNTIKYYEKYIKLTDEIILNTDQSAVRALKKDYKKKAVEDKLKNLKLEHKLTLEKSKNQEIWNWFILILALILFLSFLFYFRNSKIQKQLIQDLNNKNDLLIESEKKASELAKIKSQFSETISHELRTPLHGIIGLTSILISEEKEKLSTNGQGFLENLKFSADYLLNLINDVLEISKISSSKVVLEDKAFNLKFLVSNLSSTFKYLVNKNHNQFKIEMDNDIPINLKGDPIRLSQIIINLVGNALKFTQEGEVKLSVKLVSSTENNARILFAVEDNGSGIPKEKQKSIFEKFVQIREQNASYAGTGLGLPIVKEVLELFGSSIHLESEVGKGSKFWFEINFSIDSSDENDKPVINRYNQLGLENKKILLVDDNEINLIVSEHILTQQKYKVTVSKDGFSALEAFSKEKFDLILMDLHMPNMDGVETVEKMRQTDTEIPIVLLSASNISEVWDEYKTKGFNDFIVKPYDKIEFLQKILQNIDSSNSE